jgi:hypothetical protein
MWYAHASFEQFSVGWFQLPQVRGRDRGGVEKVAIVLNSIIENFSFDFPQIGFS